MSFSGGCFLFAQIEFSIIYDEICISSPGMMAEPME